MTPEQWKITNAVFQAAVQQSPHARSEFVRSACEQDEELIGHVNQLLAGDQLAIEEDFLSPLVQPAPGGRESSALPQGSVDDAIIGSHIDRYEIVSLIGRGGMGNVYLARRTEDYRQQVAIKLIKRDMDSPEIVERFREETQFLAALSAHPHIAALTDAGTTEEGLPYYVMEYVEGQQIDQYCELNALTVRRKLELFLDVCEAVHYAHQRTILHRDLKPSNVLVNRQGVVKLIDFGIAKLIESGLGTEPGNLTQTGQRLLTPNYASPEQIRGETLTITSDIYSLGVLLYELLTGRRPREFTTSLPAEIEKVLSRPLQRPSAAVTPRASQDDLQQTTVFKPGDSTPQRVTNSEDPHTRKLRRQLTGDLDKIMLMALRTEPDRRYASADAFAGDIRRHLAGKPVSAQADTLGYRMTKFVRRNRLAVVAAAAILICLLGGIVGTTNQWLNARAEWHRAEQNAAQAATQAKLAEQAQLEAKANLAKAFEAIDRMLTHVGESRIANVPRTGPLRRKLLEDALALYREFLQSQGDHPGVLAETARAYRRVAHIHELLGDFDIAAQEYQSAINLFNQLDKSTRQRDSIQQELATCDNNWASVLADLGRLDESERLYRRAIKTLSQLVEKSPGVATHHVKRLHALSNLGVLFGNQRRFSEADEVYQTAVGSATDVPSVIAEDPSYQEIVAYVYNNQGVSFAEREDWQAAERNYQQSLEIRQELADRFPDEPAYQETLASTYNNQGYLFFRQHRLDEAQAAYETGVKIQQTLGSDFPSFPTNRRDLARLHTNLAVLFSAQGDPQRALPKYRKAISILRKLSGQFPRTFAFRDQLAQTSRSLAEFEWDLGNQQRALEAYESSLQISDQLVRDFPQVPALRHRQAKCRCGYAVLLQRAGQTKRAEVVFRQVIENHRDDPVIFAERGSAYARLAEWNRAIADFSAALDRDSQNDDFLRRRANAYRATERPQLAVVDYTNALKLAPDNADIHRRRGSAFRDLGDFDNALSDYSKAISIAPDFINAYNSRGLAYEAMGEDLSAAADFDRAIALGGRDAVIRHNRARVLLRQKYWERARADYVEIVKLTPHDFRAHHELMLLCFKTGNTDEIDAVRQRMFELYESGGQSADASLVVWSCSLPESPLEDQAPLLQLARETLTANKTVKHLQSLGAALYRSGKYEQALRTFHEAKKMIDAEMIDAEKINAEKINERPPPKDSSGLPAPPMNVPAPPVNLWLYLAMTTSHLGMDTQATIWLKKAAQTIETWDNVPADASIARNPSWIRVLTSEWLHHQAKSLLSDSID